MASALTMDADDTLQVNFFTNSYMKFNQLQQQREQQKRVESLAANGGDGTSSRRTRRNKNSVDWNNNSALTEFATPSLASPATSTLPTLEIPGGIATPTIEVITDDAIPVSASSPKNVTFAPELSKVHSIPARAASLTPRKKKEKEKSSKKKSSMGGGHKKTTSLDINAMLAALASKSGSGSASVEAKLTPEIPSPASAATTTVPSATTATQSSSSTPRISITPSPFQRQLSSPPLSPSSTSRLFQVGEHGPASIEERPTLGLGGVKSVGQNSSADLFAQLREKKKASQPTPVTAADAYNLAPQAVTLSSTPTNQTIVIKTNGVAPSETTAATVTTGASSKKPIIISLHHRRTSSAASTESNASLISVNSSIASSSASSSMNSSNSGTMLGFSSPSIASVPSSPPLQPQQPPISPTSSQTFQSRASLQTALHRRAQNSSIDMSPTVVTKSFNFNTISPSAGAAVLIPTPQRPTISISNRSSNVNTTTPPARQTITIVPRSNPALQVSPSAPTTTQSTQPATTAATHPPPAVQSALDAVYMNPLSFATAHATHEYQLDLGRKEHSIRNSGRAMTNLELMELDRQCQLKAIQTVHSARPQTTRANEQANSDASASHTRSTTAENSPMLAPIPPEQVSSPPPLVPRPPKEERMKPVQAEQNYMDYGWSTPMTPGRYISSQDPTSGLNSFKSRDLGLGSLKSKFDTNSGLGSLKSPRDQLLTNELDSWRSTRDSLLGSVKSNVSSRRAKSSKHKKSATNASTASIPSAVSTSSSSSATDSSELHSLRNRPFTFGNVGGGNRGSLVGVLSTPSTNSIAGSTSTPTTSSATTNASSSNNNNTGPNASASVVTPSITPGSARPATSHSRLSLGLGSLRNSTPAARATVADLTASLYNMKVR